MSIFDWLLIGHLVGDWLLQNDGMARAKRGQPFSLACLGHCLVYTAILTLTVWGSASATLLRLPGGWPLLALLLFVSHWLIDGFDLARRWGQLYRQSNLLFVQVVVDQTMHLLVLALLAALIGA